ncbi:hypothetical protein QLQ12_41650 [Actinoplanes sp. NEAU-A12]|uniref:Uncharacterized protein n=1 Tax=Actinoplanes sandaracinus TaxID=3045177 RepID=A0ABT6WZK6_9ACTN|nr:hypothetical protein [Actinoplanes sandaracinus]MDI6105109.1 hypothetical protein [Actinoplanes sandaracinus]
MRSNLIRCPVVKVSRFGHLAIWPLAELGPRMGSKPVDLAQLRPEFAHVPRNQLPPYQVRRGW